MRALLTIAMLISASALLAREPAMADDDPWQGSDIYKRTLVPPDRPELRGSRPLYPWRDGSMHTITEPPPPRPKFDPSQGAGPAHAERNAPRSRQDDNSWEAELEQNKSDPRFCATHTRTASALDRCARAQNGEPQAEDYRYTPGPGQPGRQIVVPGDCQSGYVMTANGCQLHR